MDAVTPASTPTVLVVDDDEDVLASVERGLRLSGFHVLVARDGAQALRSVNEHAPDAIVLDMNMPVLDGAGVVTALRAMGNEVPICVLSARASVDDRISGLESGADDYLVKPFDLDELLARVRALVRRTYPEDGAMLSCADLVMDTTAHTVRRGTRPVELSRTESALLEVLLRNSGQALPRETLIERVWGTELGPTSNSLEVYIRYLRRKLESGDEPRLIHTVRGIGYRLAAA
ncbi:response regulator transcription factor [Streptomyces lydicus]